MLRLSAVSIAWIALIQGGCSTNKAENPDSLEGAAKTGKDDKPKKTRRPDPPEEIVGVYPRGNQNLGNTCFFNAYTQVLVHNAHFKAYVESLPLPEEETQFSRVVNVTKRLVRSHEGGSMRPVNPRSFLSAYATFNQIFRPGPQQDAMEAFEHSTRILSESAVSVGGQPLNLFQFNLRSNLQCPHPEQDRSRVEPAGDLRVDLPVSADAQPLEQLLTSYFSLEYNTDFNCDDEYQFPHRELGVWKRLRMDSSPQLLVIQLKRFRNFFDPAQMRMRMDLIRTKVVFAEHLSLSEAVHGVNAEYRLVGVVRHSGATLNGGHYIADYWHPELESWVHANDSQTFLVTGPNLSSSSAYLLFYEQLPPS